LCHIDYFHKGLIDRYSIVIFSYKMYKQNSFWMILSSDDRGGEPWT